MHREHPAWSSGEKTDGRYASAAAAAAAAMRGPVTSTLPNGGSANPGHHCRLPPNSNHVGAASSLAPSPSPMSASEESQTGPTTATSMVPLFYFKNKDTVITEMQHNNHFHLLAILTSDNEIYMSGTRHMPAFEHIAGACYRCVDGLHTTCAPEPMTDASLFDWDPSQHTVCIDALPYPVTQLCWAPWQNGIYFAALCPGRGIHFYRYSHSRWTREDVLRCEAVQQIAFSPVGYAFVCACGPGGLKVFSRRIRPPTANAASSRHGGGAGGPSPTRERAPRPGDPSSQRRTVKNTGMAGHVDASSYSDFQRTREKKDRRHPHDQDTQHLHPTRNRGEEGEGQDTSHNNTTTTTTTTTTNKNNNNNNDVEDEESEALWDRWEEVQMAETKDPSASIRTERERGTRAKHKNDSEDDSDDGANNSGTGRDAERAEKQTATASPEQQQQTANGKQDKGAVAGPSPGDDCLCVAWDFSGLLVSAAFRDGIVRVFSIVWRGPTALTLRPCSQMDPSTPRGSAGFSLCQQLLWAPLAGRSFLLLLAVFSEGIVIVLFQRPMGLSDNPLDNTSTFSGYVEGSPLPSPSPRQGAGADGGMQRSRDASSPVTRQRRANGTLNGMRRSSPRSATATAEETEIRTEEQERGASAGFRLVHLASVPLPCREVMNAVWNTTGTRFVTSHRDSTVNVWRVDILHSQRRTANLLQRHLLAAESRRNYASTATAATQRYHTTPGNHHHQQHSNNNNSTVWSAPSVSIRHVSSVYPYQYGGPSY